METDPERFEAVFREHARDVQAYCLRRASVNDAHDAAAEVFVVVWRRMDSIPPDDRILSWLYGIASRVISNQRRASRRRTAFLKRLVGWEEDRSPGPEQTVISNTETQEVLDALDTLSRADREIVMLVTWEEMTREQAAQVLGCSVEAAKKRHQRAMRRLGRTLGTDPSPSVPPSDLARGMASD